METPERHAAELRALECRIAELEAKLNAAKAPRAFPRPGWPLLAGLLMITGALAQSSDPIVVGPDGNVKIGKSLSVSGDSEFAGKLSVNGASEFRGSVNIGSSGFESKLLVKGEIQGRPWLSREYTWRNGQGRIQMTRVQKTACFLTEVAGRFDGLGEAVRIVDDQAYWYIEGSSGDNGTKPLQAKARCIGAPDNAW